jgi:hypothetical protein
MTLRRLGLALACWALLAPHRADRSARVHARGLPARARRAAGHAGGGQRGRRGAVPAERRRRSSRGALDVRGPCPVHRRGHPRPARIGTGLHERVRLDLPERVRPFGGDPRRSRAARPAGHVVLRRIGRAVDTRGRVRSRRKRSTPTSHLEDARFCVERGPLLADHCESCGFELRHAARLCPACGTRVPPAAAPSEERKLVTSAVR